MSRGIARVSLRAEDAGGNSQGWLWGAVFPGVTVEAASSVLIEKVRKEVTDDTGQYGIHGAQPGSYVITYTLSGLHLPWRRRTVSVTSEHNANQHRHAHRQSCRDDYRNRRESHHGRLERPPPVGVSSDIIDTVPSHGAYGALLTAVPGIQVGVGNGGAMTTPFMTFFTANGGRAKSRAP